MLHILCRAGLRADLGDCHHQPLEPRGSGHQIVKVKLQLAAIMRLQAQQAIGERVEAAIHQHLKAQKIPRRFAHLPATIDQEVIVHPETRA